MPNKFTKRTSSGGVGLRNWLFASVAVLGAMSCPGGARADSIGAGILGPSHGDLVSTDQQPVPEPGALFSLAISIAAVLLVIKQRNKRGW
jgi:hypothetical protein